MPFRPIACAFATVAPVFAQPTFVIPSKANTTPPGATYSDSAPQLRIFFSGTPAMPLSRVQYLYDVTDIPIAAGMLSAVAVRPPANSIFGSNSWGLAVSVSVGPNTSRTVNASFAGNHGASPATVYSGSIDLPSVHYPSWPAPWHRIPFSALFPYQASSGSSLVVQFDSHWRGGGTWSVEGYRAELGNSRAEFSQSSCQHSAGGTSTSWEWVATGLVPGGLFSLSLIGYPGQGWPASNVLFLSPSGLGSPIGPYVTPFPLGLVAPSRPNCDWAIGVVNALTVPMAFSPLAGSLFLNPPLRLPASPAIQNVVFYSQNLALDVDAANNPALFPSVAIRWLVGTGNPVPVSQVHAAFGFVGPPPTGTVVLSEGASLQFTY